MNYVQVSVSAIEILKVNGILVEILGEKKINSKQKVPINPERTTTTENAGEVR